MADRLDFKCEHCSKLYSSYKSRWLHIKKYHNHNVSQKLANVSIDVSNNVSQKLVNVSKVNLYKCKNCDNEYKHRSSKSKHEKTCKPKDNNKIEIDEIKKQNEKLENQIVELKELLLKSMKIHPKTLQKINNQLNNETNNINNGTINNINIIPLGKENLSELLTDKEKMNVLSKYGNCLTELVKLVHVSDKDKYKQFKSMYITNLQNNVAYKYDDKTKKFIAITKTELLESIINNRIGDIEEFYCDYKDKITPFTAKQITCFLEKMNDEKEYKDVKKEEIKFAIYNGREEIINQIKVNNPELNLFI